MKLHKLVTNGRVWERSKWITLKFDPRDQAEINRVMAEVAKSKIVSVEEAEALGFETEHLNKVHDAE